MSTHLIHIGNSLGVRIPKAIIAQAGFKENMDLVFKITEAGLLIAPASRTREGWTQAFQSHTKEEPFWEEPMVHTFDEEEWKW